MLLKYVGNNKQTLFKGFELSQIDDNS